MADAQGRKVGRKPTPKRRVDAEGRVRVAGKVGNGEGSVYYSPGAARWEAKAMHPSLGRRIKRAGPTRELALQRLNEAMTESGRSAAGPLGADPSFSKLLAYYLDHVAASRVARTTLGTYRTQGATLIALLGERRVRELTKADLQVATGKLFRDHSYHYANGCKRLAKRVLGEAIDLGYLRTNPVERVASPARPDRTYRTLTLDEHRKLVSEALKGKYRHGLAVALLFTTGMRVSEALGLRWEDIDYDEERLTISRAVTYLEGHGPVVQAAKTKATNGPRHLPPFLHAPLKVLYRKQLEERIALGPYLDRDGEGFIFVGTRHQLVNRQAITKELHRICDSVGIDRKNIATHTGRRTVITNLYRDGEVTEDIAAAVGHADPSTTRGYVQSFGDRPERTARRMAQLLVDDAG